MTTARRERFVRVQVAWMLAAVVVLAVLDTLTLDLFFATAIVGLLIVTELTAPFGVTPTWRARLRWVVVLGILVFGAFVLHRILSLLPPGVF